MFFFSIVCYVYIYSDSNARKRNPHNTNGTPSTGLAFMKMTCTLYKARSTPVAVSAPIHRIECIRLSLYSSRSCVRTHDMTPHQMHILSLPSPPPPSKKPRCSTYLAHALHAYRPTGRWRSGTAPPLPLPQLADRMRASGSVRHPFGQQRKVLHANGLAVQLAFRIVWWRAAVNTNRNKKKQNNVNRIASDLRLAIAISGSAFDTAE